MAARGSSSTTTTTPAPTVARPWQVMEDGDTPNRAYWSHYRDDINSLHPSCSVTTPTPETVATPMETEDATQGDRETETTVRVVTYREERGGRDNNRGNRDRNTGRGDRGRRRGMPRHEGRRDRIRRDQERAREEARRQRDRGDRTNRERRGPKKD